ncbi:MAG: NRDE family protein [Deltaproteobacteria bacterium]|nr:NRDE family protein [Deltaproteobacteria bacterium]
MCTIIALRGVHPGYPLIVAANRDEFTSRRATGPVVLSESPRVAGGLDRQGRGTWLGVTGRGFFVGITNQRTWRMPDSTRRSRGALVLDALRLGSVDGVEAHLKALAPRSFNPFNLLFGDAASLAVAYVRDDAPEVTVERLPAGMHVLTNDRMGSPWFPKAALPHAMTRALRGALDGPRRRLRGDAPGAGRPLHSEGDPSTAAGLADARGLRSTAPGAVRPHPGLRHRLRHAARGLPVGRRPLPLRRRTALPHGLRRSHRAGGYPITVMVMRRSWGAWRCSQR